MKRSIIVVILLLSSSVFAAQQPIEQLNWGAGTVKPSVMQSTINSRLDNAQDNFTELYDSKESKAVVQASAPGDLSVDWYDTDQEPGILVLKKHNGTTWVRASSYGVQYQSSCASITAGMCVDTDDGKLYYHNNTAVVEVGTGSCSYTLPTASADTLGGIKVGSRLTIANGILSADVQSGTGAVDSVNGTTGTVVLDADDISDTSTTKKFTTAAEKNTWNAKQNALVAGTDYLAPTGSAAGLTGFPTLNQNTTGSAAKLTTARTIGGVSFDGSANISLPGVNAAGTQNTSGNAATATTLQTARTIGGTSFNGSANIDISYANLIGLPTLGTVAQYNVGTASNNVVQLNASGELPFTIPQITALQTATGIASGDTHFGTFPGTTIVDNSTLKTALQSLETAVESASGGGLTMAQIDTSAELRAILTDEVGTGAAYFVGGALGTPASATLTNATGLPISGLASSTSLALGVGTIELGHASDTTIARSAAGAITVEGVAIPTISSTGTFTGKSYDVNGTGNSFTDVYENSITILKPADVDDPIVDPNLNRAVTLTGITCTALGGGTISVDLQECDANSANCVTTGATIASCGSTKTTDTTLTDTALASGGSLRIFLGAPSGTVDQVSIEIYGTQVK